MQRVLVRQGVNGRQWVMGWLMPLPRLSNQKKQREGGHQSEWLWVPTLQRKKATKPCSRVIMVPWWEAYQRRTRMQMGMMLNDKAER